MTPNTPNTQSDNSEETDTKMESPASQSSETNTCERCGDDYDRYPVFVRDTVRDLRKHEECEYDHLCKPCRLAVTDYGAFLTASEREEIEPKTEDMIDSPSAG